MSESSLGGSRSGVVIATLTYKRTDDLPELLPLLDAQAGELDSDVRIVVVDNDAAETARDVVGSLGLARVRYVVEPTPGIASARNKALEEAGGARLLLFIDDDERPEPGWLRTMVQTQQQHGCAAVAGAVIPDVGRIDDPWIRAGEFFVRKRHESGSPVAAASTANLLLDLDQVGDLRFDERFNLTGGEDTLFTRQLVARGGTIVWCDEAVVVDHIRVSRLSRHWVLQRHFSAGNSSSICTVELQRGGPSRLAARVKGTGLGVARIAAGLLRAGYGWVSGSLRHRARGMRTAARGLGMTAGAWGGIYTEYRRHT